VSDLLLLQIHRAPQLDHLAIEFHVHLVEVPTPLAKAAHPAKPLTTDVRGRQRSEAVPPMPHGLVANVDAALGQAILDIAEREVALRGAASFRKSAELRGSWGLFLRFR